MVSRHILHPTLVLASTYGWHHPWAKHSASLQHHIIQACIAQPSHQILLKINHAQPSANHWCTRSANYPNIMLPLIHWDTSGCVIHNAPTHVFWHRRGTSQTIIRWTRTGTSGPHPRRLLSYLCALLAHVVATRICSLLLQVRLVRREAHACVHGACSENKPLPNRPPTSMIGSPRDGACSGAHHHIHPGFGHFEPARGRLIRRLPQHPPWSWAAASARSRS